MSVRSNKLDLDLSGPSFCPVPGAWVAIYTGEDVTPNGTH